MAADFSLMGAKMDFCFLNPGMKMELTGGGGPARRVGSSGTNSRPVWSRVDGMIPNRLSLPLFFF